MIEKLQKALSLSEITEKIQNYILISPPGLKSNEIYIVETDKNTYILKVVETENDLVGEEDIFDLIYDSKVHELLEDKKILKDSRKLVFFDTAKNNIFNNPFIILKAIRGKVLKDIEVENLYKYFELLLNELEKLYSNFLSLEEGYISPNLFKQNNISLPLLIKEELNKRIENKAPYSQINFFKNDISRDAPQKYKDKLIEVITFYIDTYLNQNKINSLVHCDLKKENIIIELNGDINVIDWSRACIGDPNIDIADIIVSLLSTQGVESAIRIYEKASSIFSDLNFIDEKKIQFYMYFKLFSIGRVHHPEFLEEISKIICENSSTNLTEFINLNKWVIGKNY